MFRLDGVDYDTEIDRFPVENLTEEGRRIFQRLRPATDKTGWGTVFAAIKEAANIEGLSEEPLVLSTRPESAKDSLQKYFAWVLNKYGDCKTAEAAWLLLHYATPEQLAKLKRMI